MLTKSHPARKAALSPPIRGTDQHPGRSQYVQCSVVAFLCSTWVLLRKHHFSSWTCFRTWAFVLAVGFGCASTRALPAAVEVPDDALRSGWAEARIAEGAPVLLRTLSEGGVNGFRALRLRHDEVVELFNDAGRVRIEQSVPGLTPSPRERRWQIFAQHRDDALVGWCARGVRITQPNGPEGFRERVLLVERLLIVGAEPGGRWGAWIEALVLTGAGWRMIPWVPYADAVEAPRRDHSDLSLWDCDLAQRAP